MNLKKAALGTAFVALGLLLAAPNSWAGPDKNGGGDHGGGGPGGGDGGKNGGGDHGGPGGPGGHNGGHGGHDGGKNGGGKNGGNNGGNNRGGRDFGGGNSGPDTNKVVCVIGNQIVYVRRTRDCLRERYAYGSGGGYDDGYEVRPRRVERRLRKVRAPRRVVVQQTEEVYVYAQPRVRYVAQPSLAAMQQAERRARRAQRRAAYGYAGDGYEGGGYGYDGYGDVVVERRVVRKKRYGKRRHRQVYAPAYTYDQGAVIHYGPAVTKGGAYFD